MVHLLVIIDFNDLVDWLDYLCADGQHLACYIYSNKKFLSDE
jgi:hypothetical protein